jgi:UDP-N-acetylmuramoylalanine--D-glutamate ligase
VTGAVTDAGRAYDGRRVLVAGIGVSGAACADVLLSLGARVTVVDRAVGATAQRLREAGATVLAGDDPPESVWAEFDDLIVSPGYAPHTPVVRAAVAAGRPVYSEPELAWRLRDRRAAPWLALTGTNGKTTTVTMLATMLQAAGWRAAALGNIGEPLVHAARTDAYDVIAVELSSFQLHWSSTMAPPVGAWLNLAEDHLEWHLTMDAYGEAKRAIWRSADNGYGWPGGGVAVGNLDDPAVAARLAEVPGRVIGFGLGEPSRPDTFGVRDGHLVGWLSDAGHGPEQIIAAAEIRPAGRHNVANALAAAAMARAYGAPASAIRDGLRGYLPEPHRNAPVATVAGVTYVDDSKATNPHAAYASLTAYPRVVWVAGGQLKGVDIDPLVSSVAERLVGVVLLGIDRAEIAESLRRHAPRVPVVDVARTDDGAMAEVVAAAASLGRAGDTVLLAPAAASKDMFISYAHRGDAFAAAVDALPR